MRKTFVLLILFLLVSAFITGINAQTKSISPVDTFSIPALNSKIQFSTNVSYTAANLENNTWFFTGLQCSGKGGYPIMGHLHVSAENCTVVITYLQSWSQPESHYSGVELQWIKYTVIGTGTQTLNGNDLFPDSTKWTEWTVKINGEAKQIGDCWNYSDSKQLTISTPESQSNVEISVYHVPVDSDLAPLPTPEPALNNFTSINCFEIPSSNGTINFAVDGSFDKASLNSGTWSFVNLTLSSYAINAGTFTPNVTGRNVLPYILQCDNPANLGISVQNCNITVTSIMPLTWHSTPQLNYTIQGNGSQVFTFPFRLADFNWTVYIDVLAKPSQDGWFLISDNQIEVINATSTVAIMGEPIPTDFSPKAYVSTIILFTLALAGTAVSLAIIIIIMVHRRSRRTIARKETNI